MRKLCLTLCLSLLSSLFHAVAMPVETIQAPVVEAVATHAYHACSEERVTSTPAKSCHLSGHLCCLGITAAVQLGVHTTVYGTALFNPVLRTLALQDHPNKQFKPPKLFLQS
jgi:hypothetical protein